jgi:predicted Zn-dependent protease
VWSARLLSKILPFTLSAFASSVLLARQSGANVPIEEAKSALANGKTGEAEQRLDSILKDHPADLRALILKGVILDSQQRYSQAERYYQRALKLAPNSAQVLNNMANHLLGSGDRSQARQFYRKTIAIDPHYANANLQLAQMSIEDNKGQQALAYLSNLDNSTNMDTGTALLRARALALVGQCSDASLVLGKIEDQPNAGINLYFSTAMTFAQCKLYERAENSFSRVLDADPTNFDVQYNLALASLEAGHPDRAIAVLETALKQRPDDPDCLFALAQAYLKQERTVDAAALLAKVQKLAPGRAEVVLLLAQVSARLEFFMDAAENYEKYLKLKPGDDVGRRERGFMLACANQFNRALPDLEWYVHKHPSDGVGFYELGIARSVEEDRKRAFQDLNHALELNPGLSSARYARALLNIEEQRPDAAIPDLRIFVEREPNDYRALAHLGQAYLALDRAAEAADVLKRAVDLAPNARLALVHYRRALVKLGRKREAEAILARLKQSRIVTEERKPQTGLVEYLSLAPADQRVRYLANLQKQVAINPTDPQWKLRLARELLIEGDTSNALDTFRQLKAMSPESDLLAECGKILLDFQQYDLARQFLEPAISAEQSLSRARLDLAIVRFHLQGPQIALAELDQTPATDQKGDYYLLRAQILDSLGKIEEAVQALNRGIRSAPTRPDLYLQAAGFLIKHNLIHEALKVLDQASIILPDARELLLAQAVTLDLLRREEDAQKLLTKIQARWPEWERAYVLSGMLLEIQLKSAQARQTLETAIALGADTPGVYYYLARAILHAAPDDLNGAQNAITHALALTASDPYILVLGGKISLAQKNYSQALERLLAAKRLQPSLIPAHYALRDTYKALGDKQKSNAELDDIKRLASENPSQDTNPFSMENFLFGVRPPG